ncbi:MAG: GNAT family N-acetyltransferase [Bryobacteraceae bacterium]
MSSFAIRAATSADVPLLLALIREMAAYERMPDKVLVKEDSIREHLFSPAPLASVFFAEEDGEPVGYAIVYPVYSSYAGVADLFLEDLFLRQPVRGKGYGKRFMAFLARHVKANGYRRLCWCVLTWNTPSIEFYERLGAIRDTDRYNYDLEGTALDDLARLN